MGTDITGFERRRREEQLKEMREVLTAEIKPEIAENKVKPKRKKAEKVGD